MKSLGRSDGDGRRKFLPKNFRAFQKVVSGILFFVNNSIYFLIQYATIYVYMQFIVLAVISFFAPLFTHAHVGYVISHDEMLLHKGPDALYLLQALAQPANLVIMFTTILVVGLLYYFAHKNVFIGSYMRDIRFTLTSYYEYVPWILRLALGMALIGSGVHNVLISPLLGGYAIFSFLQIMLGFLMLTGFLLIPAAITSFVLYLFAFTRDFYILGNLEFAAAALAMIILDNARPGLDDILLFPSIALKEYTKYVPFILRVGLGGSMIFLAFYEKLLNPHLSELVVTQYTLSSFIHVSPAMWVVSAGIVELILGIFFVIGFRIRLTSAVAFIVVSFTFFFFREDVYSHITFFGILSALFVTGAGAYSVDTWIIRNRPKISPLRPRKIIDQSPATEEKIQTTRKRAPRKKKTI